MRTLSKEDILGADDLRTEDVEVPEWDGKVTVRMMTGTERDKWEASLMPEDGESRKSVFQNMRARLIALTAINGDGELMFTAADMIELGKKNAKALDRVFAVASRLNGLTEQDIEEVVGNLGGAPSGLGTSPSVAS